MWLLHLLPDSSVLFFTYLIIFIGIACYLLSKALGWYLSLLNGKLPLELAGIVTLAVGAYLYGGHEVEQSYKLRVQRLEEQIRIAESKSQQINTIIEEKVVNKVKIVKEIVHVNTEIIKEVVGAQLDTQCSLPVSTVVLHNSASQNEISRGAGSVDGGSSNVKASELLTTVVENYGTCYEMREKLLGWQQWYREQQKIFEESQK
jgi:hypothetical protein